MELAAYIVMAVGAYLALLIRRRVVVYFWFVTFVSYSLTMRLLPPTIDMINYASALTTWPPPLSVYTIREPLIWMGAPFLHMLVGNRVMTFLLVDIVSGVIVVRAMQKLDDGTGRMLSFAPAILSSYVILLGQQNAWRQQVAFVIFLWALAARWKNQRHALPLFVLSMLAHNSTVILLGYWFDIGRREQRHYGPLITIGGVILLYYLTPVLGKSSITRGLATGVDTTYLYVAVSGLLCALVLYANRGRFVRGRCAPMLNFAAFVPAILILESAPFERVAMMFLVVILMELYRFHRPLRLREMEVAHLAYMILVIPVFLFPSALGMLQI